jgi:NADH-quinone oxidoreductase subunit F
MYVIDDSCDRCGFCLIECALEAISKGRTKHTILQDKCTRCGACYEVCPIQAIVLTEEPAP